MSLLMGMKKLTDMNTDHYGTNHQESTVTEEISRPLFVSIPVPSSVVKIISSFVKNNHDLINIKWIPEDNYHITLFYLGRIKTEVIPEVQRALFDFFQTISPFKLTFQDIAIIQNKGRDSMIWATFSENINFDLCTYKIRKVLLSFVTLDPFLQKPLPHITIARFNHTAILHDLIHNTKKNRVVIQVKHCELRESNRIDNQIYYREICSFELG